MALAAYSTTRPLNVSLTQTPRSVTVLGWETWSVFVRNPCSLRRNRSRRALEDEAWEGRELEFSGGLQRQWRELWRRPWWSRVLGFVVEYDFDASLRFWGFLWMPDWATEEALHILPSPLASHKSGFLSPSITKWYRSREPRTSWRFKKSGLSNATCPSVKINLVSFFTYSTFFCLLSCAFLVESQAAVRYSHRVARRHLVRCRSLRKDRTIGIRQRISFFYPLSLESLTGRKQRARYNDTRT